MPLKRAGWLIMAASGIATAGLAATQPNTQTGSAPAPPDAGIEPFSGHYVAEWKDITVGTSDLKLEREALPNRYHYLWTISARGIFRLVYSDDVTQQSWFGIVDDHIRPDRYRAAEGSSTVSFDFDWNSGHARGSSEGKPVDLELKQGAQDLMSIQVEIMLDLKNGNMPSVFHIIDKDQMKEFLYTREGPAKLRTPLGLLDTIIVASRRSATDSRVLRMWFAPSLGFVPIQAERTRDGKLEFAIRIKSLKR
jgi:Protein of unknown function (DUF3108)